MRQAQQDTTRPAKTAGKAPAEREKLWFSSGGTDCAAWFYPGTNGGCVIMTGGFGVTKEPGTDLFARRFNDAGFAVLAFDYRHLGESGGLPRQVAPIREQLADWHAAITFAAGLPGVDPARLAVWSFSGSGGHILKIAARNWRPRSRRHRTRGAWLRCAMRPAISNRPRWSGSPAAASWTDSAAWPAASRGWCRWPASREAW